MRRACEAPMRAKVALKHVARSSGSLVRGQPNRKEIVATQIPDNGERGWSDKDGGGLQTWFSG